MMVSGKIMLNNLLVIANKLSDKFDTEKTRSEYIGICMVISRMNEICSEEYGYTIESSTGKKIYDKDIE